MTLLWLGPACRAAESDEVRDFVNEEAIWAYAPEGLEQEDLLSLSEGKSYGAFWNAVWAFLTQALSLGLTDSVKLLARVCGILLMGAIGRAMSDGQKSDPVQTAFRFLFLLMMTLVLYGTLSGAVTLVGQTMDAVCAFLTASLPVSGLLLAMNGEVGRATLQGVSLQHVIGIISVINTQVLEPVLRFLLALALAGAVAGEGLGAMTDFLARFLKRSTLILFTLLSAVLALQNALATAADSVAMRGVRFAAGSFIPVVGNLVGEASRTLAAGIDLIKKECGVACVLILAYLLARPLIMLLLQKAALSVAGGVGSILGDAACAGTLKGVCAVWDLFLAVTAFQGCYCVFSIVLFLGGGATV